jgi:ribosomal protein S27E
MLDSELRDRVRLLGGKVAGVDCPECEYRSTERTFDAHTQEPVDCPDCGRTILTVEEKGQLRRAGKL